MMNSYYGKRFRILVAIVISASVFYWCGDAFGIPSSSIGYGGSVLAAPHGLLSMVVIAVLLWLLTAVSSLIVGSIRADAGLFCTCLGAAALSLRSGATRYTLFGHSNGIWITTAVELVLLGIIVGGGFAISYMLRKRALVRPDDDSAFDTPIALDLFGLTIAIHSFAMIAVISLLCRSDQRLQCLLSVGIGGWVASVVTHLSSPARPGAIFCVSPVLVGLLGYIWSSMTAQPDFVIGQPGGYFATLARPLPLDYVSAGVAGSLLGYWIARSWAKGETTSAVDGNDVVPTARAQPA